MIQKQSQIFLTSLEKTTCASFRLTQQTQLLTLQTCAILNPSLWIGCSEANMSHICYLHEKTSIMNCIIRLYSNFNTFLMINFCKKYFVNFFILEKKKFRIAGEIDCSEPQENSNSDKDPTLKIKKTQISI